MVCKCDRIEFNTVHRDDCEPFKQVIFWGWSEQDNRYNVRGWVDAAKVDCLSSNRVKYGKWIIEGKISFSETIGDPEIINRKLKPERRPMPWER